MDFFSATHAGPWPTCIHSLVHHAATVPQQRVFTFLSAELAEESHLTYRELLVRAAGVAARLETLGLRGERVMLFHPPGPGFVVAFCACLIAGAVAVPLPPPATRRLRERAVLVIDDCRAAAVLTIGDGLVAAQEIAAARNGMQVVVTDGLPAADAGGPASADPAALAFLQYTSGSTGTPKGVMVSNANLVANSRQIASAFALRPGDVAVSWLPLHHDMGLIGSTLHILHQGMHCVHLTPQAMVSKPLRWLQAIDRYRAAASGGPDFAWRLLAERLTPVDLAGLDLSCWRVAYSGAEPVRPATLQRAAVLLGSCGFRESAFLPCYGLAEATLFVSGGTQHGGVRHATAWDPSTPEAAPGYVSCGCPVPADAVVIADPDMGAAMPERRSGEVWVHGPHVAAGYWAREADSERVFRAHLPGDARAWLRTGDLGFLLDGELFITGRIKDLLIINGRKHHAEDVEATIQGRIAECASGAAAAFQTDGAAGHALVLCVEIADGLAEEARADLRVRIATTVWQCHGIAVDTVAIVRLGRLPRTTSGKVRRSAAREMHREGVLGGLC